MGSKKREKSPKPKKSKGKADEAVPISKNDVVTEEKEDSSSAATITTSESTRSRGKRSVAYMYKVVVKKAMGKKFKVTYNTNGNPNGPIRHPLQGYIGMLARTMVPINIKGWPDVDVDLKDRIWEEIQNTFKVAPESKKLVLTSAGTKWRQFKTTLTRKYVLPFLGQKRKLKRPPKQYNFVGLGPWRAFVKERSTEEWLILHNHQAERVRKRKYPHRLSRKGYVGLEDDLRKEYPERGDFDRAIMWKKARERKNGEIDEELTPVLAEIDELLEKKKKGELTISGSDDVLSKALKTTEHSGRVRGVGGFVNPSTYFQLPKQKRARVTKADLLARDRERDMELEETRKNLVAQQQKTEETLLKRIAQLEKIMMGKAPNTHAAITPDQGENNVSPISDKASFHDTKQSISADIHGIGDEKVKHNVIECEIITHPPENNTYGATCELAVGNISNIVAFGTILEDEVVNKTIHGVPLEKGCVRVTIDGEIQSDAKLPFSVKDEMETVGQAVGSHVAWPEDLVIRKVSKKKNKKAVAPKTLFQDGELHPFVPKRCKLLYKHAKTFMSDTGLSISTVLDDIIFGFPRELYILTENVIDLLEMKWIGAGVISAYMAHLHEILEQRELLDTFGFVDPAATYKREGSEVTQYIVNRLREGKADRIFFVPHNPGNHWILTIIWEDEIYMLDSLAKPTRYLTWEKSVIDAVKTFNAETGRSKKQPKCKPLPGAPKQPGGHECGYYVMRYMKEIIDDEMLGFTTKWASKTRKEYTQEQLDEVRIEVADFLQNLL